MGLFGPGREYGRSVEDIRRDQDARRTRDVNESAHPNKTTMHDLTQRKR